MSDIIYNGDVYKPYDQNYYVSAEGEVFSKYIGRTLKHNIDLYGYHRVDIHGKHKKVHQMVYSLWVGPIQPGMQVNHKDDNKDHNHVANLYAGTQKENIRDCFDNGHRVGNVKYLTVRDKDTGEVLTFCPASDFIDYSGHPCGNGSVKRMFKMNWFKKRYDIIDYGRGKV